MNREVILKKLWPYFLGIILVLVIGCEEREVPIIVDADEIARYINESDVGLQLFRKNNLITGNPYTIPEDPEAIYIDRVDSVSRLIGVYIVTDSIYNSDERSYAQDFGSPIGVTRDAEATVDDRFYVHTIRVEGSDTTSVDMVRNLRRYGYFVKLYGDDQRFAGWYLWAYNGGGAFDGTEVTVYPESGDSFRGDTIVYDNKYYLLLDVTSMPWDTVGGIQSSQYVYLDLIGDPGIAELAANEEVRFEISDRSSLTVFHTLSYQSGSGYAQTTFLPGLSTLYDVTITTPGSPPQWNLVFMQEFRRYASDTSTTVPPLDDLRYKGWCIPYRVSP